MRDGDRGHGEGERGVEVDEPGDVERGEARLVAVERGAFGCRSGSCRRCPVRCAASRRRAREPCRRRPVPAARKKSGCFAGDRRGVAVDVDHCVGAVGEAGEPLVESGDDEVDLDLVGGGSGEQHVERVAGRAWRKSAMSALTRIVSELGIECSGSDPRWLASHGSDLRIGVGIDGDEVRRVGGAVASQDDVAEPVDDRCRRERCHASRTRRRRRACTSVGGRARSDADVGAVGVAGVGDLGGVVRRGEGGEAGGERDDQRGDDGRVGDGPRSASDAAAHQRRSGVPELWRRRRAGAEEEVADEPAGGEASGDPDGDRKDEQSSGSARRSGRSRPIRACRRRRRR